MCKDYPHRKGIYVAKTKFVARLLISALYRSFPYDMSQSIGITILNTSSKLNQIFIPSMVFQLKLVVANSKEEEFARNALFSKHSEMKGK